MTGEKDWGVSVHGAGSGCSKSNLLVFNELIL
jgi:hypothetical protein